MNEQPVGVAGGQSLSYNPETQQGSVAQWTAEDFEQLLTGPFIAGFTPALPGISDLQGGFERLFPDIPYPGVSLPIPFLPLPSFSF